MKHFSPSRPRSRRHSLWLSACPTLAAALLIGGSCAQGATLTWDPGATPVTGSYGSGPWDAATTSNWSNGATDQVFGTGNTAVFAGTSTGTAAVTLGSAISALNLQFLSSGYTVTPSATNTLALTGGFGTVGATVGTGATIYAGGPTGTTATVGGPLTIAATGSTNTAAFFTAAAGNTLNLTGTITQTTPATSGNTVFGPGTVSYGGTGFATGKFNVQGGAIFNNSGPMTGFTGTYAGVGGDSTTTSTWNVTSGGSVAGGAATLFVGNSGGTSGVFTVSGGGTATFAALNVGNSFNSTTAGDSTGVVTVNNSTLTVNGNIRLGSTGAGVGTLNIVNGGRVVTTGNFGRGAGTAATGGSSNINLNGGTIQTNSVNLAIPATVALNIQEGGGTINTNSFAISLATPLLHGGTAAIDGGFTKIGSGILTFTVASTYTGPTTVTAGTGSTAANTGLSISVNGGLSSGNVTLGATTSLTLAAGVTAAHSNTSSTLTLTSTTTSLVNLTATTAGTVQDTIGALIINGVNQAPGTYGSTTSGVPVAFQVPDFTGNGVIVVTGAVPEPSTWAMMLGGAGGLLWLGRSRRRNA